MLPWLSPYREIIADVRQFHALPIHRHLPARVKIRQRDNKTIGIRAVR
jgi:hypothetical protein